MCPAHARMTYDHNLETAAGLSAVEARLRQHGGDECCSAWGDTPPPGNIRQCLEMVLVITAGKEVSCPWDDPKYPTTHRTPSLPNTHTPPSSNTKCQ